MATTYFQDTTNKNSGNFSIRLQNQNGMVGDLPGMAWLGTAGTSTANVGIYAFPFSQNINSFGGFFRYAITTPGSARHCSYFLPNNKGWVFTGLFTRRFHNVI